MAKPLSTCKVCGTQKFLNFAGLCKKCNRNIESSKIVENALEKKHEMQESHSEELKERQALEEKDELTREEKERLVELSPGIKTIAELDEQVKETEEEEETKEEKPDEK